MYEFVVASRLDKFYGINNYFYVIKIVVGKYYYVNCSNVIKVIIVPKSGYLPTYIFDTKYDYDVKVSILKLCCCVVNKLKYN